MALSSKKALRRAERKAGKWRKRKGKEKTKTRKNLLDNLKKG